MNPGQKHSAVTKKKISENTKKAIQDLSPNTTAFKKGHQPWNTGLKGVMGVNSGSFKPVAIGTITKRKCNNGKGYEYQFIKTESGWKRYYPNGKPEKKIIQKMKKQKSYIKQPSKNQISRIQDIFDEGYIAANRQAKNIINSPTWDEVDQSFDKFDSDNCNIVEKMKFCLNCETFFQIKNIRQKFCSKRCQNNYNTRKTRKKIRALNPEFRKQQMKQQKQKQFLKEMLGIKGNIINVPINKEAKE